MGLASVVSVVLTSSLFLSLPLRGWFVLCVMCGVSFICGLFIVYLLAGQPLQYSLNVPMATTITKYGILSLSATRGTRKAMEVYLEILGKSK
jgi:hypothetical protein